MSSLKKCIKKIHTKIMAFVTWIKYHHKFDLGPNVVLSNIKCVGVTKKVRIKIGAGSKLCNCSFVFNSSKGNSVEIGSYCNLQNAEFILRNGGGNKIKIGDHCTTGGNVQFAACEGKTIIIGDDCQFAHDISLWTTDHHPIYDYNHIRINGARDIILGNHIWLGTGTLVLKGANINNGNIIGAHSVVSANCDETNSIYVGAPAKLKKKNVVWERRFQGDYEV